MTVLAAANYYDEGRNVVGYVLASDSAIFGVRGQWNEEAGRVEFDERTKVLDRYGEKVFYGNNFIGLHQGPILSDEINKTRSGASRLDGKFEDIRGGKRFNDFGPLWCLGDGASLLVAKRHSRSLGLYHICQAGNGWKTKKLHAVNRSPIEGDKTSIWFGPINGEFIFGERQGGGLLLLENVLKILTFACQELATSVMKYNPGEIHKYVIDMERLGRLRDGRVESFI